MSGTRVVGDKVWFDIGNVDGFGNTDAETVENSVRDAVRKQEALLQRMLSCWDERNGKPWTILGKNGEFVGLAAETVIGEKPDVLLYAKDFFT